MLMVYGVGLVVYIAICFLLLTVVLLQQGKGGGIAAAFGGSSSQTAFGARAGATVLTRATAVLGTLFMVGAFLLTAYGRSGSSGSVVGGLDGPAQQEVPGLPTDLPTPPPGGGSNPPPSPPAEPPPAGGGS